MKFLLSLLLVLPVFFNHSFANDYEKIDAYARNTPEKFTKDVQSLTAYLIKPAKDDKEKVRSFYVWLTENIAYDIQAYRSFDPAKIGDIKPDDVLKRRKAVCQGYSELFQEMCRLADIKCYVIPGYSKGFGYQPENHSFTYADHAWNAVYLNDQWYLIDATWGSGGVDKQMKYIQQFNEKYFLTSPQVFVRDHLPLQPVWQLLDCPVSMKAFAAGEEAIAKELATPSKKCTDYHQKISELEHLPTQEQALQNATDAYAFNPANHQVMARGYIDYANYIMKSIKPEMHTIEEIKEGAVLQEEALVYLKKAEVLLNKVKGHSANLEKDIVRKNIQLSEKNLAGMRKYLNN